MSPERAKQRGSQLFRPFRAYVFLRSVPAIGSWGGASRASPRRSAPGWYFLPLRGGCSDSLRAAMMWRSLSKRTRRSILVVLVLNFALVAGFVVPVTRFGVATENPYWNSWFKFYRPIVRVLPRATVAKAVGILSGLDAVSAAGLVAGWQNPPKSGTYCSANGFSVVCIEGEQHFNFGGPPQSIVVKVNSSGRRDILFVR